MSSHGLELYAVKGWADPQFPRWKLDAAECGRDFVLTKVFPAARARIGRPWIRWFSGEPTAQFHGMTDSLDPGTLWISTELRSRQEIITIAAHETCHNVGYHDEDVPTLVGRLVGKHYSGDCTLLIHHGSLKSNWVPDELATLPANARCLVINEGVYSCVNDGTTRDPHWRRVDAIA